MNLLMRYGLNTFLYASPFTDAKAPALLRKFARWGFDTAEVAIEDPKHVNPRRLREVADKAGIKIGSVCAALGPGRDLRGTPAEQRTSMLYLTALVDHAAELGASHLIGPLYSVVGRAEAYDAKTKAAHWKSVVRNLRELADHAEARGVTLAIEPLNRFETDFLNTVEQGIALVRDIESPAAGLLLDTFHMNIEEKDQADAIRRAGRHLVHFHACGTGRGVPGDDHLDWPAIVAALRAIRYDGDVVIESFTPDVEVIAKAAAIWRSIVPHKDDIPKRGLAHLRKVFGKGTKRPSSRS
jgi:D-psicose/D-tagatose/L-ribulose 3-epimerase